MKLDEKIMERLKRVIDPETGMNVVEMDLIKDLGTTADGEVKLKFRPSSFVCPLAFRLAMEIWQSVQEVEGVNGLHLEVVDCLWAEQINQVLREEGGQLSEKGG